MTIKPGKRPLLAPYAAQRLAFTAVFIRTGSRKTPTGEIETLLFRNICLAGRQVADHQWFDSKPMWRELKLHTGTVVMFNASVSEYERTYNSAQDELTISYALTGAEDARIKCISSYMKGVDEIEQLEVSTADYAAGYSQGYDDGWQYGHRSGRRLAEPATGQVGTDRGELLDATLRVSKDKKRRLRVARAHDTRQQKRSKKGRY
jgi:hypothetical protein